MRMISIMHPNSKQLVAMIIGNHLKYFNESKPQLSQLVPCAGIWWPISIELDQMLQALPHNSQYIYRVPVFDDPYKG